MLSMTVVYKDCTAECTPPDSCSTRTKHIANLKISAMSIAVKGKIYSISITTTLNDYKTVCNLKAHTPARGENFAPSLVKAYRILSANAAFCNVNINKLAYFT